jgi:hypothetical protein
MVFKNFQWDGSYIKDQRNNITLSFTYFSSYVIKNIILKVLSTSTTVMGKMYIYKCKNHTS